MNKKVYKTLEYNKILTMLSSYAACDETKKRCLSLEPITDLYEIRHLQTTTADALSRLYKDSGVSFVGIHNVHASLKRLDIGGALNTTELLRICSLLEVAKRVKAYGRSAMDNEKQDSLSGLFAGIEPVSALCDEIKRCILSEEEIADDASPELFKIRKSIRGMNDRIHAQLTKLMNNSTTRTYLQDAVVTMRDGRYCLPVKAEAKGNVPGMMHDQSSTGSTLFIEPMAVVNLNNELKELFIKEQEEIEKILAALSDKVAMNAAALEQDYEILSELDFIFAKANLAKSYNGVAPEFNTEGHINIRKGRHPLLDAKKVVPIDVRLGEEYKQLIITGPNTGGKTVSLKTVGLLTLMGQAGLHIPAADRSKLAIFEDVFADIGDEQSIEQNLSTFSSHMTNIVSIVQQAHRDSLVLLDELCGGTDPIEGAALAISILSDLHGRGIKTMATTHYSELKMFALSTNDIENASCEFDVETLSPTYRLMIGIPGKSNAFAISRKLGLDEHIIEGAADQIDESVKDFETILADLEKSKQTIEKEQEEILEYRKEIETLRRSLKSRQDNIKEKRDKMLRDAREEAHNIISEAKEIADSTIREYNKLKKQNKNPDANKKMEHMRSDLRGRMTKLEGQMAYKSKKKNKKRHEANDFHVGDEVYVTSLSLAGTVSTLPNAKGDLYVQMGMMRSLVNIKDLEITKTAKDVKRENQRNESRNRGRTAINKSASIRPEINVMGMTVDEAIAQLDKYIDDACLANLAQITVVHGKGTGALRKGLHNYFKQLKKQKRISGYRDGEYGEGDLGVTVVIL